MRPVFKTLLLVAAAAFVAQVVPLLITSPLNRLVANITNQWYLSATTRIFITILVTAVAYGLAYLIIRCTTLRKSIIFNVISFLMTFSWSVGMGLIFMPD